MKSSTKTKLDRMANKRDSYKCVDCGRSDWIETHHIITDLEELSNLITLCHSCHKKKHNMAGCFKNGEDKRRSIGGRNLIEKNKTHYFNIHTKQWTEIDKTVPNRKTLRAIKKANKLELKLCKLVAEEYRR